MVCLDFMQVFDCMPEQNGHKPNQKYKVLTSEQIIDGWYDCIHTVTYAVKIAVESCNVC